MCVYLGEHVVLVDGGVTDVTHGGRLDDIPHHEALHRLVLRDVLAGEHADNTLDVTPVLLVTTIVTTLLGHDVRLGGRR